MGQDEDLLPAFVGKHGPSHLTQIRNLLLFHLFILQNYISDEFYVPDFPETALKPGTLWLLTKISTIIHPQDNTHNTAEGGCHLHYTYLHHSTYFCHSVFLWSIWFCFVPHTVIEKVCLVLWLHGTSMRLNKATTNIINLTKPDLTLPTDVGTRVCVLSCK